MIKQILQCLAVLLLSVTVCQLATAAKKSQPLDAIVAVVNEVVITQSDLNPAVSMIKKQLIASRTPLPSDTALRKQVLDQLINKSLQLQLAERMGIKKTDEEVAKTISDIASNNKLPVSELYNKVAEQGVSAAQYRKEIHDQLVLQHVQHQALGGTLSVSPREVDEFMRSKAWQAYNAKEYHLDDILISLPETPSTQDVQNAKKRAQQLLAKIRGGLNFNEAAVAESGEESALQGGDLGWRKLPEIPDAFASKVVDMKVNEVTGPIQTSNGFHLIRLVASRSVGSPMNADQQRKQVEQLVYQRKLEEALQTWITKLRSDSFIKVNV